MIEGVTSSPQSSPASYSDRHLDPAEALAYRDKFARSWTRRLSHAREKRLVLGFVDEALDLLPDVVQAGSPRLLDFPCGAGRFAPLLAPRVARYVGADHSPAMLSLCRDALDAAGCSQSASFVEGDARDMPLEDASFDIATCIRLIHHFQNPAVQTKILAEFARVTTGPLVLTFLDADAPKQWLHARRCALSGRRSRRAPLSREQLASLGEASGWKLLETASLSGLFSGQSVALLEHR